jgi:hypothetical protein
MAIKNNYWKTLSKTERHYTAWPGGWEIYVHTRQASISFGRDKTGALTHFDPPKLRMETYYDIPKGCTKEARAGFRKALARDKRIAQSVTTREEYEALWRRIDEGDWEFIEEKDLKDEALVYWANNTRTADEYYKLLRYN